MNNSQQDVLSVLSNSEKEILQFIQKGLSSSEIAIIRECSSRTVEKHRSNIIKKLGIKSSQNALLIWLLETNKDLDT
ncbi:helix-turn-helix transcriptional regulator [Aequorivita nionensis]|uniref:helix-turn-helix transcriptional regulator n=1 Tax=Flavobacteriaceae TaxID=49546 RepID=UPI0039658E30